MGSWDCYCAICGASLVSGKIGSGTPRAREKRRKRIEKEKRKLHIEKERQRLQNTPGLGEKEREKNEEEEEDESDDDWEEIHSYDPELVTSESLEWLRTAHCLGFNSESPGISKAFISGPGRYDDYGSIHVSEGDDPNQPDEDSLTCYHSFDPNETQVFPFHWCCFKILARALTGSPDTSKIDKDTLYNVMAELSPDYGSSLQLEYGNINGREQFWESIAGEEFCVTHPLELPGFGDFLRTAVSSDDFKMPLANLDLERRTVQDPLSKLPYDLLYIIFPYLGSNEILALIEASRHVYSCTRDNRFWKQLIRWETLPWFWELRELLTEERSPDFNYKGLYLWLDKMTTPELGMKGRFLGIANRRRIWSVCQQLAGVYFKRVRREPISETDEYAKAILVHSVSAQMPMVLHPQLKEGVSTVAKQWIRSWNEIDSEPSIFETFWNNENALVGLSVTFESDTRVFGRSDIDAIGGEIIRKQGVRIPADDWITSLVLHIPEMNLLKTASTFVKGVTLVFKSGKNNGLGDTRSGHSQRPLIVSPGQFIVGVIGQLAGNGLISRLGLLECLRPPNDDFSLYDANLASAPQAERPEVPISRRLLWHSSACSLPTHGASDSRSAPIWLHPNIHIIPPHPLGYSQRDVPGELLPHQVLLWAKEPMELRKLIRISSYVPIGGKASGWPGGVHREWPIHDVLAIRCEFLREYWEPKRAIGNIPGIEDSCCVADSSKWNDENVLSFEIDGPGGEIVTQLEISRGEDPKAIKLRTNRGRVTYFGELDRNDWDVQRAPEGEYIVGLSMTFGETSGYSDGAGERTYLKMTSITALSMTMDLGDPNIDGMNDYQKLTSGVTCG
ncbi:hypothetical protein AOQ84DRAFT_326619 [Glonium stellatum]|uniref:F-box domain-containing protein n=1 Tax=Glonium stellatum TaxID=574774 RepID=A0A8E2JMT0_9PEZI|nr:hypothetical protein AOQ84DRAFT_326619 [Glonium stellatum]